MLFLRVSGLALRMQSSEFRVQGFVAGGFLNSWLGVQAIVKGFRVQAGCLHAWLGFWPFGAILVPS